MKKNKNKIRIPHYLHILNCEMCRNFVGMTLFDAIKLLFPRLNDAEVMKAIEESIASIEQNLHENTLNEKEKEN